MSNLANKCFMCGGALTDEAKCRDCGAQRQVNQISGNIIWVRDGQLVAAFQDEKDQWVKMAARNGVPESEWPERFRTKE